MTAAHTLYRRVNQNDPTNGFVRADDFEFFLGLLLLKPLSFVKGQIQYQGEILANEIKAHVLHMDEQFLKSDCQERQRYDWAVLKLELEEYDIRTKQKEKPLKCNFDFDLGKNKDCLVTIAGYPRMDADFETDQQKWKIKKSSKIIRSKEDTSALYFQEIQPIGLSQCKQFLHYEHSVSSGSCGAPLLVLNPQTQSYETIGVHVGKNGKNCGVGLLSLTVSLKSQIESLILQNKHSPIDLKRQYWTQFDCEQEIRNMAAGQQKCLQYKIELTQVRDGNNLLDAVAENGVFFPYLHQIKANRATEEQSISFVRAIQRFPHLQKLEISRSYCTDQTLFELIQQSSKLANLKQVIFYGNRITQEGLNELLENGHKLPCLQTIDLSYNQITGEGLRTLFENGHKLPCLQSIDLSFNQITGKRLKELIENGEKFPCLRTINQSQNNITGEQLKELAGNGGKFSILQTIILQSNQITDEGFKAVLENGHKFPCLRIIDLSYNKIIGEQLKGLPANGHKFSSLQTIILHRNQITDGGLKAILQKCNQFPCLQTINLRANQITEQLNNSQQKDEFVLNNNDFPSLQTIDLSCNGIRHMILLVKHLPKLPRLKNIDLSNNRIQEWHLRRFLQALVDNYHKFPNLQAIDLSYNQITMFDWKDQPYEEYQLRVLLERLKKLSIFKDLQWVNLKTNQGCPELRSRMKKTKKVIEKFPFQVVF